MIEDSSINGKKEGCGAYSWADGSQFIGQWKDNVICGLGTHIWSDGRVYSGQWEKGIMHGYGKYVWTDGKTYEGQFNSDKKHGYGIYTWPDGRLYKGYWRNGKQHGLAEYCLKTGSNSVQSRYGLWEFGQRKKWFDVDKGLDLQQQLREIEELNSKDKETISRTVSFSTDSQENDNKQELQTEQVLTFKSPAMFHEKLWGTLVEVDNLRNRFESTK